MVDPVLGDAVAVHPYARGSWGPKEAERLLPDGDTWHDPAGLDGPQLSRSTARRRPRAAS